MDIIVPYFKKKKKKSVLWNQSASQLKEQVLIHKEDFILHQGPRGTGGSSTQSQALRFAVDRDNNH